jgi:putative transposase
MVSYLGKPKLRWETTSTTVYNLGYHVIWCPKFRKRVLIDGVDERLKILLLEKAKDLDIEIKRMEIMPDHVHLFIKTKPTHSIHFIIGQLKGYSSHYLRKEFTWLRSRLPTLWTRSYYVDSVGQVSEKNIERYIENQKEASKAKRVRSASRHYGRNSSHA